MNGCKVLSGLVPLSTHAKSSKAVLFFAKYEKKKKKTLACMHDEVRMESKDTLIPDPKAG